MHVHAFVVVPHVASGQLSQIAGLARISQTVEEAGVGVDPPLVAMASTPDFVLAVR